MYIAIDIGGTNVRIGLLDATQKKNQLVDLFSFDNTQDFETGIETIIQNTKAFLKKHAVQTLSGIGVGMPGVVNVAASTTVSQNLPTWSGKSIRPYFTKAFHVPFQLENDAVVAAIGEAVYGAGKSDQKFVYIIWGTGIGGTKIERLNGKMHITPFEPCNMIIQFHGRLCACGQRGCLEAYIGGRSIEKIYGKHPSEIHDGKIWEEIATHATQGIINITALHLTKHIIFGGGFINKQSHLLKRIEKNLKIEMKAGFTIPTLSLSSLGENGALYGGMGMFMIDYI